MKSFENKIYSQESKIKLLQQEIQTLKNEDKNLKEDNKSQFKIIEKYLSTGHDSDTPSSRNYVYYNPAQIYITNQYRSITADSST